MIESLQAQLLRAWRVANIELYDVTLDHLERVIDIKKKICE